MERITQFRCGLCGMVFGNEQDCRKHEIEELGISEELYQRYHKIRTRVARASYNVNQTNNEKTRREYDEAIEQQLGFEKETGISWHTWSKL